MFQEKADAAAVDTVVIAEDVSGLVAKGCRISKLLNHPFHGRVIGFGEMNDRAATMIKDEKNIQCGEMDCRDGEEIDSPGDIEMVPQER